MIEKVIKSDPEMRIAGDFKVKDWKAFKISLKCGNHDNWEQAYKDYFLTRIQTRYFDPIETLIKQNDKAGEGFSIVALQCSLIEFLASTLEGKNYKYCETEKDRQNIDAFEYHSSAKLFKCFLRTELPFKQYFGLGKRAHYFYKNVRCPLLHEARTKGGWIIRAGEEDGPQIKYKNKNCEKIIYRNSLQAAFVKFVEDYGKKLPEYKWLQCAFIRKFDGLCKE